MLKFKTFSILIFGLLGAQVINMAANLSGKGCVCEIDSPSRCPFTASARLLFQGLTAVYGLPGRLGNASQFAFFLRVFLLEKQTSSCVIFKSE